MIELDEHAKLRLGVLIQLNRLGNPHRSNLLRRLEYAGSDKFYNFTRTALGVIDVATLSVIKRWALREQMSIREIARCTGLSRNTLKKYLRAGEEEPRYAKRTSSSKLDLYAEKLSTWLTVEATKSQKQRRNLRQIHTSFSSQSGWAKQWTLRW
jgi:transcriptional regulator with XRE-family HTH domain